MFRTPRLLVLLSMALLALAACSDDDQGYAADPGGDDAPEADAGDEGEPDASDDGEPDLGDLPDDDGALLGLQGANDPAGVCAGVRDQPCGGDLSGVWRLEDFCTPDPAGMDRPCEGPGEDEPACAGEASSRVCNLLYGGEMVFADGEVQADFEVGFRVRYTLTDPCLAALGPGGQATCDGLGNDRLGCDYDAEAGVCACEATSPDPETETVSFEFTAEGDRISIGRGERTAPGSYCVDGDRLTIVFDTRGPEGWRAWVLTRQ